MFINGEVDTSITYARYWHGYLPILRILLIFFNISQIRVFLLITFAILMVILIYLLCKQFGKKVAIIFVYAFIMYAYFHVSYSLESTPVFLVMMISSIILLKRIDKIKNFSIFIFIVGCITSFVDFLTVPLITLAIPLYIYVLYFSKNNKKFDFKLLIKYCVLWGIGYIITWFSKWLIYDLLYNEGIIFNGINQARYRTIHIGIYKEFLLTIFVFIEQILIYLCICLVLCYTYIIIFERFSIFKLKKCHVLKENYIILIISIMPFIWYSVLMQHTAQHYYFVFRHMMITLIGILLFFNNCIEIDSKQNLETFKEKEDLS